MKKIVLALFMLLITGVFASSVEVTNQYVRATPPNLPNSAAFMTIKNLSSKDISLIKATSNIAKSVELHTHSMKNGVMKMYQVKEIKIPANSQTKLKPGGFHVMFIGLKKPLKENETVKLSLSFSNGESINLIAPIKKVMAGMHMKMMHKK